MKKFEFPDARYVTPLQVIMTITFWSRWSKATDNDIWQYVCPLLAVIAAKILDFLFDVAAYYWHEYRALSKEDL